MIEPPAHPHSILVQPPHARSGLPGIHNPNRKSRRGGHVSGGLGGDARNPLKKVQGNPFSLQNTRERTAHNSDAFSRGDVAPVHNQQFHLKAGVEGGEDLSEDPRPGHHAGRPDHGVCSAPLLIEDQSLRGGIPAGQVLLQCHLDQVTDLEGNGTL